MSEPSQNGYIIVAPEDAAMWLKNSGKGTTREARWSKAVRQANRIKARGGTPEIRWWHSVAKTDETGQGAIEVIQVRARTRSRKRVQLK